MPSTQHARIVRFRPKSPRESTEQWPPQIAPMLTMMVKTLLETGELLTTPGSLRYA
jgi:hypothetical protein